MPPLLSTYRLQLGSLGSDRARALVPYLRSLGVADVYLSPVLRAASAHGYDVLDPSQVDERVGGEEGFISLARAVRDAGLGLVLDIVPNHMAAVPENPWWWDVLSQGASSPYASHFDIEWDPPEAPELSGRVVLPVLGRPLREAVDDGELRFGREGGAMVVRYHDHVFPVSGGANVPTGKAQRRALLAEQPYRLAFWRTGRARLNYRRFFEIDTLAGVKVERDEVFDASHRLVMRFVRDGHVTALRVDHIDGLRDPQRYLDRIQGAVSRERRRPFPILVEKILGPDEGLPPSWPVVGTTGYDFLVAVNGLHLDPEGVDELRDTYARFTGESRSFSEIARAARRSALDELFPAEMRRLTRRLALLAEQDQRDVTEEGLRAALTEVMVAMPRYRTYGRDGGLSDEDATVVARVLAEAEAAGADDAGLEFVGEVLASPHRRDGWDDWRASWQQLTPAVAAKGVEDTALYRYHALVALNVVGGDPDEVSRDPLGSWHRWCAARTGGLNATSTHDTKRSEDVRTRIAALAEIPAVWQRRLRAFSRAGERHRRVLASGPAPDRVDEVLVYQVMLGAWPLDEREVAEFRARLGAFLVKAAREAKRRTSWLDSDEAYEAALSAYADALVDDPAFRQVFDPLQERLAFLGAVNSLTEVLAKVAAPGSPDVYQGTELWDFSLVDPDNRRPVDWALRDGMLADLDEREQAIGGAALAPELLGSWRDGAVKLFVLSRALRARRDFPELFSGGEYVALRGEGSRESSVVAFARRSGRQWAVALAPRLVSGWAGPPARWPVGRRWGATAVALPAAAPRRFRDALTGRDVAAPSRRLSMAEALEVLPAALLVGET